MHLHFNRQGVPISMEQWVAEFSRQDRSLKQTDLGALGKVSTVFLGLNAGFGGGPPLIFETMVFGGPLDEYIERYATEEQALIGHDFTVMRLQLNYPEAKSPALFHNGKKPRR